MLHTRLCAASSVRSDRLCCSTCNRSQGASFRCLGGEGACQPGSRRSVPCIGLRRHQSMAANKTHLLDAAAGGAYFHRHGRRAAVCTCCKCEVDCGVAAAGHWGWRLQQLILPPAGVRSLVRRQHGTHPADVWVVVLVLQGFQKPGEQRRFAGCISCICFHQQAAGFCR